VARFRGLIIALIMVEPNERPILIEIPFTFNDLVFDHLLGRLREIFTIFPNEHEQNLVALIANQNIKVHLIETRRLNREGNGVRIL
jgi:hypothetical protein